MVGPTWEADRCILIPLGMFLPSKVALRRLVCRSKESAGRDFGALCDRALARDDLVLAI
jgi:hypothetical protein